MSHHGEVFLSRAAEQSRDALGVIVVTVGENDRVECGGVDAEAFHVEGERVGMLSHVERQRKRVSWRVASTYRESPCCPSRGLS
jgi:hypothetical protein